MLRDRKILLNSAVHPKKKILWVWVSGRVGGDAEVNVGVKAILLCLDSRAFDLPFSKAADSFLRKS